MIESHVTSLELSKRLKELGVKQQSDFNWCELAPGIIKPFCSLCLEHRDFGSYDIICSAYLSSELGEMLPIMTTTYTALKGGVWCCEYDESTKVHADNETNARAKMLIHLIEQGIIKV